MRDCSTVCFQTRAAAPLPSGANSEGRPRPFAVALGERRAQASSASAARGNSEGPRGFQGGYPLASATPNRALSPRSRCVVGEGAKSKPHPILPICALRHSLESPIEPIIHAPVGEWWVEEHGERHHCFGRDDPCCAFIGWVVVVLTSTRRERLSQRFGFRARRWRSF